uniref:Secreted protein n=1 Tax=Seriola lalandi dorsalis TaxID=1841481 RepID=A0A3B4YKH3_SERLL
MLIVLLMYCKLLIGVPSAFDTNIYTTHKHTRIHIHTHQKLAQCSETHQPLPTPSHVHQEKLPGVRFVTASTKTSLREEKAGLLTGLCSLLIEGSQRQRSQPCSARPQYCPLCCYSSSQPGENGMF